MNHLLLRIGTPALVALLALAGCVSNPYRPYKNDAGYSDTRYGPGRYQVVFHGSQNVDELKARELAILRASEIAREQGSPFFRIDTSQTREKPVQKTYVTGDPYYSYGPYGWYHGPYYGYSSYGGYCNSVTRTSMYPVVKIDFTLESEPCADCISVRETLDRAADAGLIDPARDKG